MKKILVVRYRFIGDTILSVPFLRNLRYAYPDAQIDMLIAPGSGEVVDNCPYVDNFIYFDTTRKHKYEKCKGKKKSFWYYVFKLRSRKYDKAYILKRSLSSAILCFLAGIRERVGYNTENRSFLLTKRVPYNTHKHESLCFLDLLMAEGAVVLNTHLECWINQESRDRVANILEEHNISKEIRKAVVNVTATNEGKVWNIDNFKKIIEFLSNEKNIQVLFIGSIDDREIYENLKFDNELKIQPVNLCGEIDLKESLALMQDVEFVLGNDSGNLHMASAAGTRVIGLYGPMPFEKWKALGKNNIYLKADLPCMPCGLKIKCPNNRACMESITVEQVKNAINTLLG